MYNLFLIIHVIVSVLLVVVILVQRGRGGGLVEALAGAESLFGTKTSSFLVKTTTILAILFFVTSTTLALLSKERGRSVLERLPPQEEKLGELEESQDSTAQEMPLEQASQEEEVNP